MSDESELVKAILSLKEESNLVKDYIYPILITFFSVMLGAFFAHFSVKYQKYIDAQKEKLEIVNTWVIVFQNAFETLCSYKRTYHEKIDDQPLVRMSAIQEIINSTEKVDLNVAGLSFMVPDKDEPKCQIEKWRSLPRISGMLQNYNYLIEIWTRRNKLSDIIFPMVIRKHAKNGVADINFDQFVQAVGQENALPYMIF